MGVFLTVPIFSFLSRKPTADCDQLSICISDLSSMAQKHFAWQVLCQHQLQCNLIKFRTARRPVKRREGWAIDGFYSKSLQLKYCCLWRSIHLQTIYRTNHARNKPMPKQTKETCNTNFINLSIYGATKITSTVTSCSTKAQTSLSSHTSTKQQPPHTWSRVTKPKVPRTSPREHKTRTISNSARKINKLLELTKRTHKKRKNTS